MKEIFLSIFSLIASLFFVILFIALGWYIVWILFLRKFKFVRELLGNNGNESPQEKLKKSKVKTRKD